MKARSILTLLICGMLLSSLSSCSLFGPKYGCPSDGKNVGAERILTGEKTKQPKKFKA
jgi:predicted small lipoprotein YifL